MIGQCLDALVKQTVSPLEIIVIDNNCTDQTATIAARYPGVRVVKEPQQGVIAARNTGFAVARGDILARLDADSRPTRDWLAKLSQVFESNPTQAVTGTGDYYDAPFKLITRLYRNFFFVWLNRLMIGHHMLWGSNMALRRQAWLTAGDQFCNQPDILEDLDIAAHVAEVYGVDAVAYRPDLRVDISVRRAIVSLRHNWCYMKMWPATLRLHGYQRRHLVWPAVAMLVPSIAIGNKVVRFYNPQRERFIFSLAQWRSNPLFDRGNP